MSLIFEVSWRATSTQEGPVISRRRPEWGPFFILCYAYYNQYIVKHCACLKKKERKREICVFFLFVTGFTKYALNKLLKLSSI